PGRGGQLRAARLGRGGDARLACPAAGPLTMGQFIDDEIEVLRPDLPRGRFRGVLFDFDGTLSLIREGWPQVMIPMMVAVLRETGTAETEGELTAAVEEDGMRREGRQAIDQVIQLA